MREYVAMLTCGCAITGLLALARLPLLNLPGMQPRVSAPYTTRLLLTPDSDAAPQRLARL